MRYFKVFSIFLIINIILITFSLQFRPQVKKTVLDCSLGEGNCIQKEITNSIKTCREYAWSSPIQIFDCLFSYEELSSITYIADILNYIPSPFTDLNFEVSTININLSQPWDLEILSDGSMFITEKNGKIKYIKDESLKIIYEAPVLNKSESGLLGLAIDPEFTLNKYVYIYYTYSFDESKNAEIKPQNDKEKRVLNRLSRLEYKDGILSDEKILINEIPGSLWHSGSRLDFGPDNKLYVTTGDANELKLSQHPHFLGGKILRLNPDGSIPDDNPFAGSYTYSMGHRNPQGLAWQPVTNQLYSSEHGHTMYDEINRIIPGKNYGWGDHQCSIIYVHKRVTWFFQLIKYKKNSEFIPPVVCTTKWTMSPSGMEFVSDTKSPWFGNLFVASLRGKHLHRYEFDDDKIIKDEIFFISDGKNYKNLDNKGKISSRLRDVEYFNGSLYVIGDYFGMVRLSPTH